jgi:hypothetical protein
VAAAYYYLKLDIFKPSYYEYLYSNGRVNTDFVLFFLADAMAVLLAALVTGFFLLPVKPENKAYQSGIIPPGAC